MSDLTLLVMAAGMGSRYGGLKQLDEVGPNGETIIDYSVYDAIKAGFNKVVFIIREDFKDQFNEKISNKYSDKINVETVYQDLHDLPKEFTCPEGREKPWGTGHAILAARLSISEPFAAINGDDFYGRESFEIIAGYYMNNQNDFAMAAFQLDKTLSDYGAVSRGLCEVDNDKLITVIETHNLKKINDHISSDREIDLHGKEPVSMNMWGFTPALFGHLDIMFNEFLNQNSQNLKSEFLIPTVVNNLIQENKEEVHVLKTDSQWFGVTYKEDKKQAKFQISKLVDSGLYPKKLFS
jgi:NDP-sugar pyrophosphorylase family protein|tara:strand:- start:3251 stop:4135 length:885 start_codon:yes stop_codon:yes gene_type:complete